MFPEELAEAVAAVLCSARAVEADAPAGVIRIERPLRPEHGDFSTPAALRLAPPDRRARRELAETIAAGLARRDEIAEAWVAGAGHVNVRLTREALVATARRLGAGEPAAGRAGDPAAAPDAPVPTVGPGGQRPAGLDPQVRELLDHLGMLVRGARALGVPEGPVDVAEPAGPDARRLVCALAETGAVPFRPKAAGRPHPLRTHLTEVTMLWQRYEAGRTILPRGDEEPGPRHSAARLLAEATFRTVSNVTP